MSTHAYHPSFTTAGLTFGPRARIALTLLADSLSAWRERVSQRRALGRLDDRLLRDMGLTRADVEQEVSKPFWRV